MKIAFYTFGSHCDAGYFDVYQVLKEKGFDVTIISNYTIPPDYVIPKTIDVLFNTSNAFRPRIHANTKTFFLPHGLGHEVWEDVMNTDEVVFLAGKKPWVPPVEVNNWKIVGWAKSDALFHPRKEIVEKVNTLVSDLPFDKSVLIIPTLDAKELSDLDYVVEFLEREKINAFIPFRKDAQTYGLDSARKRYDKFQHVRIPDDIINLYYFTPHINMVVTMGWYSTVREFYITKIPSMQIAEKLTMERLFGFWEAGCNITEKQRRTWNIIKNRFTFTDESIGVAFKECKAWCYPITNFPKLFSDVWNNPSKYLQSEEVTKRFIEINDGKVIERIIKEIESRCQ